MSPGSRYGVRITIDFLLSRITLPHSLYFFFIASVNTFIYLFIYLILFLLFCFSRKMSCVFFFFPFSSFLRFSHAGTVCCKYTSICFCGFSLGLFRGLLHENRHSTLNGYNVTAFHFVISTVSFLESI